MGIRFGRGEAAERRRKRECPPILTNRPANTRAVKLIPKGAADPENNVRAGKKQTILPAGYFAGGRWPVAGGAAARALTGDAGRRAAP